MKTTQKEAIREKVRFQMLLMLSKVDEDSSTPVSHYVDEVMSLLDTYAEAVRRETIKQYSSRAVRYANKNVAEGKCATCGDRVSKLNKRLCESHRQARMNYMRNYRRRVSV